MVRLLELVRSERVLRLEVVGGALGRDCKLPEGLEGRREGAAGLLTRRGGRGR